MNIRIQNASKLHFDKTKIHILSYLVQKHHINNIYDIIGIYLRINILRL
jgi:hypothetical protein